jgi:hypothetical protein
MERQTTFSTVWYRPPEMIRAATWFKKISGRLEGVQPKHRLECNLASEKPTFIAVDFSTNI